MSPKKPSRQQQANDVERALSGKLSTCIICGEPYDRTERDTYLLTCGLTCHEEYMKRSD